MSEIKERERMLQRTARRLRAERARLQITQTELARQAKVSRRTILRVEQAEHIPGLLVAERIARALGVERTKLFPERRPKQPDEQMAAV